MNVAAESASQKKIILAELRAYELYF